MRLVENADLCPFNTFRVPARARAIARIDHWYEIDRLLENRRCPHPWLILGEGSNVLFRGDFPGTVIRIDNRGMRISDESHYGVFVRVAAGENWHKLVQWTAAQGLWGIENLALIPGTVGAAPIQNIGAYGVELKQCLHRVRAYDRMNRKWMEFTNNQCRFGYRTSRFKEDPDSRYIITEVTLRLQREPNPVLSYAGVNEGLPEGRPLRPADLVQRISHLRHSKLPDPARTPNAGSFFKNPVIADSDFRRIRDQNPKIPHYRAGDRHKLSAAWLIEESGMKGRKQAGAQVSEKHSLVLINNGVESGREIWELAKAVQERVYEMFGIILEPEPVII